MIVTQQQGFTWAVAVRDAARAGRWPHHKRITMPPPPLVMSAAPPSRVGGIVAVVDATNLIHLRSHFIVTDARQEIKL